MVGLLLDSCEMKANLPSTLNLSTEFVANYKELSKI